MSPVISEGQDDPEHAVPFEEADFKRSGGDVTIVAPLPYVSRTLEAAAEPAKKGMEAEAIDRAR